MFNVLNPFRCINNKNIFKKQILEYICWSVHIKISTNPRNHYETLKLSRNCTSKEIRDAFITLSKQYHPDKNKGNPKAQEEFVKVSEAYNILIKPESRREYDFSLKHFHDPSHVYKSGRRNDFYEVHRHDSHYRDPWKDPSFYRNRKFDEEDKDNNDSYYGIRGIKKKTNDQLLFWILLFAGVGIFIQISIIRFASTNTRLPRDRQSEENRKYLEYVKQRAEYYGTLERQLEAFKRRAGILEDGVPESDFKKEDKPD